MARSRTRVKSAQAMALIPNVRGLKREPGIKYVVSYGGGVNSTAMIIFLVDNGFPVDHVVFSDTGSEMPDTYAFLPVMAKYLKERDIPFVIVSTRSGVSLYERSFRRKVFPSMIWRWCTRDMKVKPCYAFYKTLKSRIYQYMGFDAGESHRMKPATEDYVTNLYPLVDFGIDRDGCVEIIRKAGLPVPPKSGCPFCPFNSMDRWEDLYRNYPDLFQEAIDLEENSKHFGTQSLAPEGYTLRKIRDMLDKKQKLPMVDSGDPCGGECRT